MPTIQKASIWQTEPVSVIAAAVIAVINGGLQVLGAFGVVVTSSQATSIGVFVSAAIALAALFMRSQVVPVGAPDGPDRLLKARLARAGSPMGGTGTSSARSVYRVPGPVTAPAPMLADLPRWALGSLVPAIIATTVVSLFFWGCTAAEIQWVNGGITIGGQVCNGVVVAAGDPQLQPICATAEEIAQAIAELAESAKKAGVAAAPVVSPSNAALYKQIVADRAAKAGAK